MNAVVVALALLPALLALFLPLSRWGARWRGRRDGIAFRDVAAVRMAQQIDTVILDRWGTITTGELVVSSVEALEEGNDRNLRWFAAALEHAVDHPVARAIARLSAPGRPSGVQTIPGRGVSGAVDRHPVRVGAPAWLGMEERHGMGETVAVEVDHRPFGYITVTDQIRVNAKPAVARLRDLGAETILLSAGNALDAEHLAEACGIEQWLIVSESEKRERVIKEHRERGRKVALVARSQRHGAALQEADLAVTDAAEGAPGVRMSDLDVGRFALALGLAKAAPAAALRARIAGVVVSGVGLVLAALDRLSLAGGAGCAILGCVLIATLAVPSQRAARP